MLLIPCPWCGARDHVEFTYGGDGGLHRPAADGALGPWCDYVYLRANPRGTHAELWHHTLGCRRWIRITRDTLTHAVSAAAPAGAQESERGE